MKKIFIIIYTSILCFQVNAQNLYHKLDVGTNNIFTFAAANLATAGLNYFANDMLFDNSYTYTWLRIGNETKDIKVKGYNIAGITARDLFSDVTLGGKIGYQSTDPGVFNWGLYGSAHYRINQFKTIYSDQIEENRHRIHRLLLGGGILLKFGDIESSTRIIVEAGLRYELPTNYKGSNGIESSNILNSGLSSHFAIRINGNGAFQGLGIYAEIPYYNLFKRTGLNLAYPKLRPYSFGIIYTITPWKIKETY